MKDLFQHIKILVWKGDDTMERFNETRFRVQVAIAENDVETLAQLVPYGCMVTDFDQLLIMVADSPTASDDIKSYLVELACFSVDLKRFATMIGFYANANCAVVHSETSQRLERYITGSIGTEFAMEELEQISALLEEIDCAEMYAVMEWVATIDIAEFDALWMSIGYMLVMRAYHLKVLDSDSRFLLYLANCLDFSVIRSDLVNINTVATLLNGFDQLIDFSWRCLG